mmetsp:Transcript_40182/g.126448  ORF Transcript_40182/g.126448 Transcript_40182/m.126448 type:complete len:296 (+) Transcript_40182:416-1303(+)
MRSRYSSRSVEPGGSLRSWGSSRAGQTVEPSWARLPGDSWSAHGPLRSSDAGKTVRSHRAHWAWHAVLSSRSLLPWWAGGSWGSGLTSRSRLTRRTLRARCSSRPGAPILSRRSDWPTRPWRSHGSRKSRCPRDRVSCRSTGATNSRVSPRPDGSWWAGETWWSLQTHRAWLPSVASRALRSRDPIPTCQSWRSLGSHGSHGSSSSWTSRHALQPGRSHLACYSCWSHGSWHTTRSRRRLLPAQPLELSSQSIISLLQLRVALLQTFDLVLLLAADGVKLLLLQRLPGFSQLSNL